ncbi:MAG TPA: glucose-6-phosphate isomerase, partial [Sulfitobacter sp.]|nr:glucose-6-phosphate isomerase [Sulfitobacter sp.]
MNAAWSALETLETGVNDRHMLSLFEADASRADTFQCTAGDMLLDYSKTNIDGAAKTALLALAEAANVNERRAAMFGGAVINETEGRAVLHTALRNLDGDPV